MKNNKIYIINKFWNNIYNTVEDGGYISNEKIINKFRFSIEKKQLIFFLNKYVPLKSRIRALDIGCGNGKFSKILSKYFKYVDAIDISGIAIEKNIRNNNFENINYHLKSIFDYANECDYKYDFIYVGGVLMYIDDNSLQGINKIFDKLLQKNGVLLLRESVMTKERIDNISDNYIAYYRAKDFYSNCKGFGLLEEKENLAYRVGELRNILSKLKLTFFFNEFLYNKLIYLLKLKTFLWKPNSNKLFNYYYIFKKEI